MSPLLQNELSMFVREMSDELLEQPLPLETQSFDYASLDSETRIVVQRTGKIKEKVHSAAPTTRAVHICLGLCPGEMGQKLTDVRGRLKPRLFTSWLQAEFQWSRRTAYNFIKVFESFSICANFGQIDIATSAQYLLAAPSTPDQVRQEALESTSDGETITHSKAKVIARLYKPSSKFKATDPSSRLLAAVVMFPGNQRVHQC